MTAVNSERPVTINPRTGLRESWDDHFNVPLVHQKGIGRLTFTGQTTAVHTVPLDNGLTLDFYARLGRADELFVSFHGSIPPSRPVYPRFERVASLRSKTKAMMAFADPTILVDPTRKMSLSWYLGGPGWDPIPHILRAVRKAKGKTGAKHVAFVGGSGGGFAALRASALVPGSMAFIQDPQTSIAAYYRASVTAYAEVVWPRWDQDELLEAFPERFDMVQHYKSMPLDNFVYYAQNSRDPVHVERHYTPFKAISGVQERAGVSRDGSRVFALYEGEVEGHGKITPTEFDEHLAEATYTWREHRGGQASAPS